MFTEGELIVQWLGDIALTAQFLDPTRHALIRRSVRLLCSNLPPADLRIANWEAPLLGSQDISPHKRVALHTNEETASNLTPLGLDVAIVANNHIFDCMRSGFERTVSFFDSRGVRWVGAGLSEVEAVRPLFLEPRGIRVALLAYVDADTNPQIPPHGSMYVNWLEPERVIAEVRSLSRDGHAVLVSFHCGMDFVALPSPRHRDLARQVIEAGASLVMCCHPHRIQAYERWAHGYIFYGLGNLLAGNIYPWPRLAEPTVGLTVRIERRRVTGVDIRHFIFRDGLLESDLRNRGQRAYEKANRKLAAPNEQYARHFAKTLACELAFTRPWHFVRRKRNPFEILRSLELRHLSEYRRLIADIIKGRKQRG